jgi:hypothetical protein
MNKGRVGEDRGSKETDGCPLTPSKARHHDAQRSTGGRQICSSEGDLVEEGCINVARCAGVFAVELHYL